MLNAQILWQGESSAEESPAYLRKVAYGPHLQRAWLLVVHTYLYLYQQKQRFATTAREALATAWKQHTITAS